jgi:hypothetical protein
VYTLKKKLESGSSPGMESKPTVKIPPAGQCIKDVIADVREEDLSPLYTRDLANVSKSFLQFLKNEGLDNIPITDLKPRHIKCFLQPYKKSSS